MTSFRKIALKCRVSHVDRLAHNTSSEGGVVFGGILVKTITLAHAYLEQPWGASRVVRGGLSFSLFDVFVEQISAERHWVVRAV